MNDAQIRRHPQQERSKARVETILDVALELIVESGADNIAIREVARAIIDHSLAPADLHVSADHEAPAARRSP